MNPATRFIMCPNCEREYEKPPVTVVIEDDRPTLRRDLKESRFTVPTEFCDHPHDWHSQDGDSTEWEVSEMIGGLVRGMQPYVVVETGAAWGQTSRIIAETLKENGHGHLYTLDPESVRVAYTEWYCHQMICEQWMTTVPVASLDWHPVTTTIDLLFSDSFIDVRVAEIKHFEPYTHPGTLIVMHDTKPGSPLQPELDALGDQYRNIRLHTPRGLTLVERLY